MQVKKLDEEERKTVEYDTQVSVGFSIYTSTVFVSPILYSASMFCLCFSPPGVQILVLLGLSSVYQWSYFLTGLLTPKEVS